MRDQVLIALGRLETLPLISCGRAADVQWFHFGQIRTIPDTRKGGTREVGEFALHLSCAWRIVGPQGIVVASTDRYYPQGDPYVDDDAFRWDVPGTSRLDHRMAEFLAMHVSEHLTVRRITADDIGGFSLGLGAHDSLEVFPADSLDHERWRIFVPGEPEHFVVTGRGVEA
jgi:hypothetical protein